MVGCGSRPVGWKSLCRHPKDNDLTISNPHSFHIPVMGTGFTIDTPLRVARYGISSVVSLVDDILIEQMRRYHCSQQGESYEEIAPQAEDGRARRITAYLDLLGRLVGRQVESMRAMDFAEGNDLTRYFRLLPDSPLKRQYEQMLATSDAVEKARLQEKLRGQVVAGSIDVNIMTKLDRDHYRGGEKLPAIFSDALAALRGFAQSTLRSSMVFSAGINQRLYNYLSEFPDFFPDSQGALVKKIILKVSDYRSAIIQGKYLAKRGLWVSEFRVESGLNCGGHAFATNGHLMGPILEEFKKRRRELQDDLFQLYGKALAKQGHAMPAKPHHTRITVQGGIGTAHENTFLLQHYEVDGTGWGTPFLLVPEAVLMDGAERDKLCRATEEDVFLSPSSPLGVPFWNLRTSASEEVRLRRIQEGRPGSPCPKRYLAFSTEFTTIPACISSRAFQKHKLRALAEEEQVGADVAQARELVLAKACICHDLGGNATKPLGIDPTATSAVCPGPNIVNFKKIATLEEMVDHIYGRISLLTTTDRPHMFIRELRLYVDHLGTELAHVKTGLVPGTSRVFQEFKENLLKGIDYYQELAEQFVEEKRSCFLADLALLRDAVEPLAVKG